MSSCSRGSSAALAVLLAASCLAVYGRGLQAPFVFDDHLAIERNPYIRTHGSPARALRAPDRSAAAGRPVVGLTLAANHAASGLETWSYHALNLVLHVACALLLAALLRRSLRAPRLRESFSPAEADGLAAAMALLWALHPLASEPALYVIARTEQLFALFLLLTLVLGARALEAPRCSLRRRLRCALAVACCALGMASKEVMVVAPLLVLLHDRCFFSGSFGVALRRRPWFYAGLAATWGVLVALVVQGPRSDSVGFHLGVGPFEYLLTQAGVILWYLRLAFWPHPLSILYEWPLTRDVLPALPALAAITGLATATLWALRRRPALGFLGAWLFLILAPSSSVVPVVTEVAAERRMYAPLAAILTLLVVVGWRLLVCTGLPVRTRAAAGGVLALLLAALLGAASFARAGAYASEASLLRDALRHAPASPALHNGLGTALEREGDFAGALEHYRRALELEPRQSHALFNLGSFWLRRGNLAEAVELLVRAAQLQPREPDMQSNLGVALALSGRSREARARFERALALDPDHVDAHVNLALLLESQSHPEAAGRHLREALRVDPGSAAARRALDRLERAPGP